MISKVLILLCATLAVLIFPLKMVRGNSFRVSSRLNIDSIQEGHQSDLPVVNGVRSCGGPGQVVEWRYEPCTGEGTCKIPGDGQPKKSEVEFIPSEDIDALGIRIIVVTENGVHKVYERPLSNSEVQGGQTYVAKGSGGPPKEMIGRSYTLQYILYRVENGNVEICAEADFEVVEP